MKKTDDRKDIAVNRRAFHDFQIDDKYEAGICLTGSEVKSCRKHSVSFADAYADIRNGEVFLNNLNISQYKQAGIFNHDPVRVRKLLLHGREILKLTQMLKQKGYTLVPLRMYLAGSLIKVEIGLGKGKKQYEKREDIKSREAQKDMDRAVSRSLKQWERDS